MHYFDQGSLAKALFLEEKYFNTLVCPGEKVTEISLDVLAESRPAPVTVHELGHSRRCMPLGLVKPIRQTVKSI